MSELKEVSIKDFVKSRLVVNGLNITKLADKLGVNQSSLSGKLARKTMTIKSLAEILDVMGEDLVVCSSDGSKFKILTD